MPLVRYADQLQRSSEVLFAPGDELGEALGRLSARWHAQGERKLTSNVPTLGVLGLVGAARQEVISLLIEDESMAAQLHAQEQGGLWLGQEPAADLPEGLRVRRVAQQALVDLGCPYNLWIAPASDTREETLAGEQVSSLQVGLCDLLLLPFGFEQLRDERLEQILASSLGLPVVPLIMYRPLSSAQKSEQTIAATSEEGFAPPQLDAAMLADVQTQLERWQVHYPQLNLLDLLWLRDPALSAQQSLPEDLSFRLGSFLCDRELLNRVHVQRQQALLRQARRELQSQMHTWRARLQAPLERLHEMRGSLPDLVQRELIGEEQSLRVGLRGRLRSDLLERTPLWLFPVRTLLGVLALTLGAWDRVILASMGSLPSLAISAWSGIQEWRSSGQFEDQMRSSLKGRLETLLAESFAVDLQRFGQALQAASSNSSKVSETNTRALVGSGGVTLRGLEGLETAAQVELRELVRKHRLHGVWLGLLGLLGMGLFWGLFSGPLIRVYQDYLQPLWQLWQGTIEQGSEFRYAAFPAPEFGLWLTALLLSLIPTLIVAMFLVASACSSGRLKRMAKKFRASMETEIARRMEQGELRVELHDPQVDAAAQLEAMCREE